MSKKQLASSRKEQDRPEGTPPVKVLRIDNISASVFKREPEVDGQKRVYYSVSFSRSYKDSAGDYQYVKSFDIDDLGRIAELCQQTDEYIRTVVPKDALSAVA